MLDPNANFLKPCTAPRGLPRVLANKQTAPNRYGVYFFREFELFARRLSGYRAFA